MGIQRSPRVGLTQEDYNWRKIYAVAFVYIAVIAIANLRTAWMSDSSPGKLPFFGGSSVEDMRPALFRALPTASLSQNAARVIDPSLFNGFGDEGIEFLEDMKNPCWSDGGRLKCLPYFYILGPFQAGVRDMQAKMYRHPQIVRTANPEPHFWSENRPTEKFLQGTAAATDALQKNPSRNVIGSVSMTAIGSTLRRHESKALRCTAGHLLVEHNGARLQNERLQLRAGTGRKAILLDIGRCKPVCTRLSTR